MDLSKLGYTKPLYILPFDHRVTFAKQIFGLSSIDELNSEQIHLIKEFKMLIYKGFKDAVEKLIPSDSAAILCDEQFGSEILIDALQNSYTTLLTVEASGEKEFKFQYKDFKEHIKKFQPTFAKVLIRYNPQDPTDFKERQKKNLKLVSDFCHEANFKFLLEVLVIPTESQLKDFGGSRAKYDRELRPTLVLEVIKELQEFTIEPDVWKLEGFEDKRNYQEVIQAIKAGGRNNVNMVILGRGANEEKVEKWLEIGAEEEWFTAGAKVEGVIGFAVGRTVFWEAIEKFHQGEVGKGEVIKTVSENFQKFYRIFTSFS